MLGGRRRLSLAVGRRRARCTLRQGRRAHAKKMSAATKTERISPCDSAHTPLTHRHPPCWHARHARHAGSCVVVPHGPSDITGQLCAGGAPGARPGGVIACRECARALNRDMSVSRTSWHKGVILGRNSVFGVFRLYLWLSDPHFNDRVNTRVETQGDRTGGEERLNKRARKGPFPLPRAHMQDSMRLITQKRHEFALVFSRRLTALAAAASASSRFHVS
jgi:hypothetical protein